jgi:hypothetical protein
MSDGGQPLDTGPTGPPGPITKVLLNALWKKLFDPDIGNSLYLPRIIKNGYPEWNLPSYDPAAPGGTSAPIMIPGVPDDVGDAACARDDMQFPPIAAGSPALQLENVELSNLSVMHPVSLTFSDSDPIFTAVVGIGTQQDRFTLDAHDLDKPNYLFQIACCEPKSLESRECGEKHWSADANGRFIATGYDATASLTVQINTGGSGPITITVISIGVQADPTKVQIDFDVKGKPQWVQDLAQIALNEGVGNGALITGLQSFLNQPQVIADIEKLVNEALSNILAESSDA